MCQRIAASRRPFISADGQHVVYQSLASNLGFRTGCPHPAAGSNLLPDVYAFDRVSGCVTRISGSLGQEWWTASVAPAIDAAGTLIVFSSAQWVDETDVSTDFDLFLFPSDPSGAPDRTARFIATSRVRDGWPRAEGGHLPLTPVPGSARLRRIRSPGDTGRRANAAAGSGLSWHETLQLFCPVLDHHQLHG